MYFRLLSHQYLLGSLTFNHFPLLMIDFKLISAPSILILCSASTGSTFFGQTVEHSPTNVQSKAPASLVKTSSLSRAPSSLESRLYLFPRAAAAGPMNSLSPAKTGHAA